MLGFLIYICADMIFMPVIESAVMGFSFGVASNVLNDGELLWKMEKR